MDKAHLNDFVSTPVLLIYFLFFCLNSLVSPIANSRTQITKKRFIVKLAIKRMDFKVKKNRKRLEELAGKV